jgi:hypothetical protein
MSPSRTAVQGAAVVSTAPPAWRPGYQRGPPLARHEAPSPPASPTSSSILTASWLGGQRPRSARKKRCHVRGEQLGSLECREVSAAWHLGPALNVEHLFGEGARRMTDLARERRVGGGCAGTCERNGPWLVAHRVVGPERRVDRAGDPVQRDVCEEPVDIDRRLEVAVAVGPHVELLSDPGRQSRRRIGQGIGRRLRPGALDQAVARLPGLPVTGLLPVGAVLLAELGRERHVQRQGEEVNPRSASGTTRLPAGMS